MQPLNEYLASYQLVMYAHSWALKHWVLREHYSLESYIGEGIKLMIEPFLTAKGRRGLAGVAQRTSAFSSESLIAESTSKTAAAPARRRRRPRAAAA
jgi:hypothetical protein